MYLYVLTLESFNQIPEVISHVSKVHLDWKPTYTKRPTKTAKYRAQLSHL